MYSHKLEEIVNEIKFQKVNSVKLILKDRFLLIVLQQF